MLILAATVILVIAVRLRTLQIPLERDEGEYAYAGQLMLDGIPPYKLAYNMKLPGIYAFYALIMAVFGQTRGGIHFGFLLLNLATLALLYLVAKRLLDISHAIIACVCYALMSMSAGVLGLEGHATQLVVPAALAGLLLLLKARESGAPSMFGWSGLLFGITFLCKQHGLFFGLLGLTVLARDLAMRPNEWKPWFRRAAFYCCGMALPFLLTCVLMAWAGTFGRFWFWTIVYAHSHATLLGGDEAMAELNQFYAAAGELRWTWLAAVAGLVFLLVDHARDEARFIICALLLFSLMAFAGSFYFFPHHFVMVLPAVALLIAILAGRVAQMATETVCAGVFALACAAFIFGQEKLWFRQTPDEACRELYGGNPFPEAVKIADYVREHSSQRDSVAILGSEPEIFFYAHRKSATGYIYMYDLVQTHPYASPMQREAMRQIEAAKPAYLILVNVDTSWVAFDKADQTILNWGPAYAAANYEVDGAVAILPDHAEYAWGKAAANPKFTAPACIAIMKRKAD